MQKKQQRNILSEPGVFIITTVGFFCILLSFLHIIENEASRTNVNIQVPGTGSFELTKAGNYSIYYDFSDDNAGTGYSVKNLLIKITSQDTGREISLVKNTPPIPTLYKNQDTTYFTFTAEKPGKFDYSIQKTDVSTAPSNKLSISRGVDGVLREGFILISLLFLGSLFMTIISGVSAWKNQGTKIEYLLSPSLSSKYGTYYHFGIGLDRQDVDDGWFG